MFEGIPTNLPEMVHIPAGEFLMGSDPKGDKDAYDDEQPQHRLPLPDYYIEKTPVTNAQYLAFVDATGQKPPSHWKDGKPPRNNEDHPVVWVTWNDATAYCEWLAEMTGEDYRLPSEAEWEKAARGMGGRIYPWGDEWDPKRCNTTDGYQGGTTPVGRYSPDGDSPYGLVDMAGNVWEWTRSTYKSYPYDSKDDRENPEGGSLALRGGSWRSTLRNARVSSRRFSLPDDFFNSIGFRVVVVAPVLRS